MSLELNPTEDVCSTDYLHTVGYLSSQEATASRGSIFNGNGQGLAEAHVREIPASEANSPMRLFSYRVVKRAIDICLVLLFSPILLLLHVVIAIAIRIDSPGAVFFGHRRIRRSGEFFTMWKFRTMCVKSSEVLEQYLRTNPEARAEWRQCHKLRNDPRVTRVGRFLRRTSLDELPQIWNVLNGTMSMVGPRPIVSAEVEKYGDSFADFCLVKPGITGLWQTSGRSNTSYSERVRLDRTYAQTWSLSADLKILAKTPLSVFDQHGAY
jgi:lipopolysaccharide/colanic/teichoic acid biosynthesis glycosyltransferase